MRSSRRPPPLRQQLRFFRKSSDPKPCSKCYRDLRLKEEQASSAKSAVEKSLSAASSSTAPLSPPALTLPEAANEITVPAAVTAAVPSPSRHSEQVLHLSEKGGIDRVPVQCGITFCGVHRYPEQHGCTFDFKTLGKEAISKPILL
ncbi:Zinc finger A20 and AN1 domain-containing stress-associated protein 1 [Vitis vinifera]|uniref:Zinc finger A20 and AN1 domain-containing stress-associated protein 1 n=1 Tax=Vitis vinifera TaxID=29760 RepID=A0A438EK05_VITVI|nr:Zinc finger A20 and AN1 domain-containing stress-associated protein 1 [Vitis vinifera]